MSATINQMMIERSVARLFADHSSRAQMLAFEAGEPPEALWALLVANGPAHALATEAADGIAATWVEAYPIFHALGYWQTPLPLAETIIANLLFYAAGIALPEGAIALIEDGVDGEIEVLPHAVAPRLTGHMPRVAWAGACRWALVSLTDQRIALIDLHDSATAQVATHPNIAGEPTGAVTLTEARCAAIAPNPLPALRQPVRALGALARSVMLVGALEWVLEQTVQYANDRVQFGRPIGKNQAIQQQLALLAGEVAAARMAALVACAGAPDVNHIDAGPQALFGIAVAKIRTSEAAGRAAAIAHQVHGAMGFTHEHPLNFATRRLWAWREDSGSDAWWAQRLGAAAIAGRAAGFWQGLTAQQFDGLCP